MYLVSDCFHTGPGVDINALGLLAENDDAGSGLVCSTIDYMLSPLSSPTTFYILVEGFGYNEGSFQLCVLLRRADRGKCPIITHTTSQVEARSPPMNRRPTRTQGLHGLLRRSSERGAAGLRYERHRVRRGGGDPGAVCRGGSSGDGGDGRSHDAGRRNGRRLLGLLEAACQEPAAASIRA
jgi:hypothetical protein